MEIRFLHVNLFTEEPFGGVPVPVYLLPSEVPNEDRVLSSLAVELRLPDSAAVQPIGPGVFRIRFLTTGGEVKYSSRSLLAAAYALNRERPDGGSFRLIDRDARELQVGADGERVWLAYEKAATTPVEDADIRQAVLTAVGLPADRDVIRGAKDAIVVALHAGEVSACSPDLDRVRALPFRGVGVSAGPVDDADHDIVSRYFSPQSQLDEDDVTASLHADLGAYWMKKLGKDRLQARQASDRGGSLVLRLDGDAVIVGGRALLVIQGTLRPVV